LIGDSRRYDLVVPKFRDDNRNGIQDAGEPPLANIPFTLDLNRNGRYDAATEPLVRSDANGIALFPNLTPGTYSVLEVFDASVNNPFPIPTGPNPVNFNVPGPTTVPTAVPTPVPPPPVLPPAQRTAASLVDPLTGVTDGASASTDALLDGGSSLDATVKASSVDSLIAPQISGFSLGDIKKWEDAAKASIQLFKVEKGLDDSKLLLGAPASTPLL
jgi:hypothetical protein